MIFNRNRQWAYVLGASALIYLAAFYVIPGLLTNSEGEAASGGCIQHREVALDHGRHDGQIWRIKASIGNIEKEHHCAFWFLKVQFLPEGVLPGSWTEGWGIPAGGHLPASATIDASEEEESRAIGGVVGLRVHSVILRFSGGRRMMLHPKQVKGELRRHFVWLRGFRYFLCFDADEKVRTAKLLDRTGKVLYTVHNENGDLVDSMVE